MTLSPTFIFIIGLAMGFAGCLIILLGIASKTNSKETKKPIINDDLIKELFREYLKETKGQGKE